MFKRPCFYKKGKVIILGVEILNIQAGHFYFIKDEFFEEIKDKELMVNKENGHMRPCYYCFKDSRNNSLYWFIILRQCILNNIDLIAIDNEFEFKDLDAKDMEGHEKFKSKEEMYATYSAYYNKTVDENTLVKIIKFELI